MAGYVVCKYDKCKNKTHPTKLKHELAVVEKISENTGKIKKEYYHHECLELQKKKNEFLRKEDEERDSLNEYLKVIYELGAHDQLPPQFWSLIQDVRNGTERFRRKLKIRYKKGVSYRIIEEAYRLSRNAIYQARKRKNFKTLMAELNYGLFVMASKLTDAEKALQSKKMQNEISKAKNEDRVTSFIEDSREVVYKKKHHDDDISFLLDDDD